MVLPTNALVDETQDHESKNESQEESSRTPTDFEDDIQFEETRTKWRKDQGEGRSTVHMTDEQINCIIMTITTMQEIARRI